MGQDRFGSPSRQAAPSKPAGFPQKEKPMRLKFAKGLSVVAVSIIMVGSGFAGDAVKSGLNVGDSVNPFLVDDITGPNKGNTLCYR